MKWKQSCGHFSLFSGIVVQDSKCNYHRLDSESRSACDPPYDIHSRYCRWVSNLIKISDIFRTPHKNTITQIGPTGSSCLYVARRRQRFTYFLVSTQTAARVDVINITVTIWMSTALLNKHNTRASFCSSCSALKLFALSNFLDASKHSITTLRFAYGLLRPVIVELYVILPPSAVCRTMVYTLRCFAQIHLFILSLLLIQHLYWKNPDG